MLVERQPIREALESSMGALSFLSNSSDMHTSLTLRKSVFFSSPFCFLYQCDPVHIFMQNKRHLICFQLKQSKVPDILCVGVVLDIAKDLNKKQIS